MHLAVMPMWQCCERLAAAHIRTVEPAGHVEHPYVFTYKLGPTNQSAQQRFIDGKAARVGKRNNVMYSETIEQQKRC